MSEHTDLPVAEPEASASDAEAQWQQQKREEVIEVLNGLLDAHQIDRAELAQRLGWKPARVTRVLAGKENVSVTTIAQIVAVAGADFDLVIRESALPTADSITEPDRSAAHQNGWAAYVQPAGSFLGMTIGITSLVYFLAAHFATEVVQPFIAALLGGTLFLLARTQWKLWLARRELRSFKRYLKNRRLPG